MAASFARQGTAVSLEAEAVRKDVSALVDYGKRSIALFGRKEKFLSELFSLAQECNEPNWDGYDADPIDQQALSNAKILIESLPEEFPLPECSVEPDGEISLDWMPV